MGRPMRLEKHGAEGGAEGQRDEAGDHGRGRDGDGELAEKLPRYAREEGRGHEHRAERQRDGDQRAADLVHGRMGGLRGRHPQPDIALDVLDHDDRVVHDDSHGEHESEQRQVVQRYAQRVENGEHADQRDRYGDDGNDRGAPVLQEQEHDADHEQDRHEDRGDHLIDRFADEDRGIVDDLVADARREILRQGLHGREHFALHRQRVRAGLGEDQQRYAGAAIHIGGRAVIRGADLDASDVAEARHPSLIVGFEDDIEELLRRGQPAQGLDVELIGLMGGNRRLVEDAGRDLDILGAQRGQDFARIETMGRDLVRIEPDAHRIVAGAEELDIAHPRQARQGVLHMQGRVVRDIETVARAVGRDEMDGEQDVGRRFPDLHPLALDVLGQAGQGVLDAVLRQHLGDVQVGSDLEGHRDRDLAVAGRLAAHIEHVLDAVDLLLERRCDRPRRPFRPMHRDRWS